MSRGLKLSEDAILESMATNFEKFDIQNVTKATSALLPGVAHLGSSPEPETTVFEYGQAKSSDQVINAA